MFGIDTLHHRLFQFRRALWIAGEAVPDPRRRLALKGMITGAILTPVVLHSEDAEAVSNLLWAQGTNGYLNAEATALSTELNALANQSNSAAGSTIDNSAGTKGIYADWKFVSGGAITTTGVPRIWVWLLRTMDGTNFEDGGASVTPGRAPNFMIGLRVGSSITPRSIEPMVLMPPGQFQTLAQNNLGVGMAATNNNITYRTAAPAQ